jgi:hypothetical protein
LGFNCFYFIIGEKWAMLRCDGQILGESSQFAFEQNFLTNNLESAREINSILYTMIGPANNKKK